MKTYVEGFYHELVLVNLVFGVAGKTGQDGLFVDFFPCGAELLL